jgi:hypothetical protein
VRWEDAGGDGRPAEVDQAVGVGVGIRAYAGRERNGRGSFPGLKGETWGARQRLG